MIKVLNLNFFLLELSLIFFHQPGRTAPERARIILLLFNAGPLDISHMLNHRRINAIIECYFPGQSAGGAISKVLTGAVNPAARLPNTWYKNMAQVRGNSVEQTRINVAP